MGSIIGLDRLTVVALTAMANNAALSPRASLAGSKMVLEMVVFLAMKNALLAKIMGVSQVSPPTTLTSATMTAKAIVRILCIDDCDLDFRILSGAMKRVRGVTPLPEQVLDAATARPRMLACEHDLYLVDWRLGADDGITLVASLRQQGWCGSVVFLTGSSDPEVKRRASAVGALDVLSKDHIDASVLQRLFAPWNFGN